MQTWSGQHVSSLETAMNEKVSQWPVPEGTSCFVYLSQLNPTASSIRKWNRGKSQRSYFKCYLIFKVWRLPEFLPLEKIKCFCSPKNLRDKSVTILAYWFSTGACMTMMSCRLHGLCQWLSLASCTRARHMHPTVSLASYTGKLFIVATYLLVWVESK